MLCEPHHVADSLEDVSPRASDPSELPLSLCKIWLFALQSYGEQQCRSRRHGVRDRVFLTHEDIGGTVAATLSATDGYRVLKQLCEIRRQDQLNANAKLIEGLQPAFGGIYVTLPPWVLRELAAGDAFIKAVTATLQRIALERLSCLRSAGTR